MSWTIVVHGPVTELPDRQGSASRSGGFSPRTSPSAENNPLFRNAFESGRKSARDEIPLSGRDLGFECTRYAHHDPQDLWKTSTRPQRSSAAKPYSARLSGVGRNCPT